MERELSGGANYARECATMLSILNMNYHKWNMNFSKIFISLPVQGAIKTGHGGIAAKTKNSTYTVEYITKEIGLFFLKEIAIILVIYTTTRLVLGLFIM
ncbi:MAG: hypothetical protein IJ637_08290 [Prevotella sp.]|nr:hypothetical protein [Prevotella sp.]